MAGGSKATMWAVAVGVAAVETLKDQVGLCRWNYAFRTILQQYARQAALGPTTNTVNHSRRLSGVAAVREAERADNLLHLVFWGPR